MFPQPCRDIYYAPIDYFGAHPIAVCLEKEQLFEFLPVSATYGNIYFSVNLLHYKELPNP